MAWSDIRGEREPFVRIKGDHVGVEQIHGAECRTRQVPGWT